MKTLNTSAKKEIMQRSRYSEKNICIKELPVIKLSLEGFLLAANDTGIDFLEMLSDYSKTPAVYKLLKKCPAILDPESNFDFTCRIYDTNYYFSVVSFKEAGYIGIYAYRIVHLHAAESQIAS